MTGSMAEVIAVVKAAIDAYTRRHQELIAAVEKTRQVLARVVAVTTGSTHPAPRDARRALEQSRTELEESAANAAQTVQLLTAYLASLEGSGGATGATQTPSRTTAGTRQASSFDKQAYLDDMPYMPPRRERRRGGKPHKTHGRWVDPADGPRPDAISGEDSPYARQAQQLWDRVRDKETDPKVLPIKGHYETKFAMFMRQESKSDEHIVINNPDGPCGYGLENYRFGCDRLLPVLLPQDAKLTVDWPDGRTTYTGARDS